MISEIGMVSLIDCVLWSKDECSTIGRDYQVLLVRVLSPHRHKSEIEYLKAFFIESLDFES